jgi:hypothetical protein
LMLLFNIFSAAWRCNFSLPRLSVFVRGSGHPGNVSTQAIFRSLKFKRADSGS